MVVAPLYVFCIVALQIGRIEEEAFWAESEDVNSVAAHAELRTAPSLGEEPVLLALMGVTVLVVEGGGEGHRKEGSSQEEHFVE